MIRTYIWYSSVVYFQWCTLNKITAKTTKLRNWEIQFQQRDPRGIKWYSILDKSLSICFNSRFNLESLVIEHLIEDTRNDKKKDIRLMNINKHYKSKQISNSYVKIIKWTPVLVSYSKIFSNIVPINRCLKIQSISENTFSSRLSGRQIFNANNYYGRINWLIIPTYEIASIMNSWSEQVYLRKKNEYFGPVPTTALQEIKTPKSNLKANWTDIFCIHFYLQILVQKWKLMI